MAERNRKAGNNAELELVSTMSAAEVILVQVEATEKRRIELDNRLTMHPSMNAPAGGGRSDRSIARRSAGMWSCARVTA